MATDSEAPGQETQHEERQNESVGLSLLAQASCIDNPPSMGPEDKGDVTPQDSDYRDFDDDGAGGPIRRMASGKSRRGPQRCSRCHQPGHKSRSCIWRKIALANTLHQAANCGPSGNGTVSGETEPSPTAPSQSAGTPPSLPGALPTAGGAQGGPMFNMNGVMCQGSGMAQAPQQQPQQHQGMGALAAMMSQYPGAAHMAGHQPMMFMQRPGCGTGQFSCAAMPPGMIAVNMADPNSLHFMQGARPAMMPASLGGMGGGVPMGAGGYFVAPHHASMMGMGQMQPCMPSGPLIAANGMQGAMTYGVMQNGQMMHAAQQQMPPGRYTEAMAAGDHGAAPQGGQQQPAPNGTPARAAVQTIA